MSWPSNRMRFGLPFLLGLSVMTAGLADFLFYDHVIGWTLGGFIAWVLLMILLRNGRVLLAGPKRVWGWTLTLATVGLCVSLALEPGVLAWVLAMVMLGSLVLKASGGWTGSALGWDWLGRLAGLWVVVLIRPLLDSGIVSRWSRRAAAVGARGLSLARTSWAVAGVVMPIVLSLVFLSLFSLANPVVADWMARAVEQVGDLLLNTSDYVTVTRVLLWLLAGFCCWGLLRHRGERIKKSKRKRFVSSKSFVGDSFVIAGAQEEDEAVSLEATSWAAEQADKIAWVTGRYQNLIVRCLIAINVVFALQLVLDSRYLVLGEALPKGMSHAEYAHRGAYPLIVTALFAAGLVLAVFRPGGVAEKSIWARRLVLLWIVQNVVLVVSAAWRLGAYVEVYTLTRLRVAAAVWMLMVAGSLFLLLWRIARKRDNRWLTGWAMGWGLAVLWVCSFVPFDPVIAGYNVRNCQEMGGHAGPIDLAYLEQLGPDALPAIDYLVDHLPQEVAEAPQGEGQALRTRDEVLVVARVERAAYEDQRAEVKKNISLGEQLGAIREDLSRDLDEQLAGWRGWTGRRIWLSRSAGE